MIFFSEQDGQKVTEKKSSAKSKLPELSELNQYGGKLERIWKRQNKIEKKKSLT